MLQVVTSDNLVISKYLKFEVILERGVYSNMLNETNPLKLNFLSLIATQFCVITVLLHSLLFGI